ncbi:hypothetical protein BpHYR1_007354 [Brachionus plicatilis]|uniref:Uncharacterized protein n=1 Tax=Brachionus plicatilis TaxID=10195 RepID=A0A3M7PD54_BRAPC|nr:hypothetical protein BpHYR1_007354 [Brachionus plicatilis]
MSQKKLTKSTNYQSRVFFHIVPPLRLTVLIQLPEFFLVVTKSTIASVGWTHADQTPEFVRHLGT